MLDGVLDDGLQREGRDAEERDRRVELDEQLALVACLFHREIRFGVLEFFREGNSAFLHDGAEVVLQVAGEVQDRLLGLPGILGAQVVDARQRVVDEMGSHLQDGDARLLLGRLLLLREVVAHEVA